MPKTRPFEVIEKLRNQEEFIQGVLALVQKHFGRKRAAKPKKQNGAFRIVNPEEEFERA